MESIIMLVTKTIKMTKHYKIKQINASPKPNAVTYNLRTIQDVIDCVTEENLEGFLFDFETALRELVRAKKEVDSITLNSFKWTDDYKPGQAEYLRKTKNDV